MNVGHAVHRPINNNLLLSKINSLASASKEQHKNNVPASLAGVKKLRENLGRPPKKQADSSGPSKLGILLVLLSVVYFITSWLGGGGGGGSYNCTTPTPGPVEDKYGCDFGYQGRFCDR